MKSLKVFSSVLLLFVCVVHAQNREVYTPVFPENDSLKIIQANSVKLESDSSRTEWDHLTIISDSRINDLLEINKEVNIRKDGFEGYRVQIYQGTKDEAYLIKSSFLSKFPDYKVYVLFQTPDFRVRIGDFRSRSEAIKLKYLIKNKFSNPLAGKELPDPFIIDREIINYPKLIEDKEVNKEL